MDYSQHKYIQFQRKFLQLAGTDVFITDLETGAEIGYIKSKAFKIREDIRIFTDRSRTTELVRISTPNIIDFGATYDVYDSASNQLLMRMKRQGLSSTFVRDQWDIMDANGAPLGKVTESGDTIALIRRYVGFIPVIGDIVDLIFAFKTQDYGITINTATGPLPAGTMTRRKSPVIERMVVDTRTSQVALNPLMALAASALLIITEGSKN